MDEAGEADEEVLLGLGSNLGDRLEHLRMGVRILQDVVRVTALSSVVESEAQGAAAGPDAPDFLNAVMRGRTSLEPDALLEACRRAERAAGRTRPRPGAPRTLDVDILFHGGRILTDPELTVPHPRWKDRSFVLRPLLEVAPRWKDPETGETVEKICRERAHLLEGARVVAAATALERA